MSGPPTMSSETTSDPVARREPSGAHAAHPVRDLFLWRVPLGVLSVVVVGILTYLATRVLPGDAATAVLGQYATPEALASLRAELGMDQALVPGLLSWFGDFVT